MNQIFSNISLLFEFPVVNISILLEGLMIGSLFALSAYGLALVWGVMNVKNLAQGDFVVAGGYVSWYFSQFGMNPLLGVPLAFVVMALLGGALHGTGIHRWAQSQSKLMISLSVLAGAALLRGVFMEKGVSHFGMNGSQLSQNAGIFLTVLLVINGGIYNLIISRVIERDLFTSLLATFGLAIMMAQLMNLMFGSDTQSIKLEYETLYFFDDFVSIPIAKLIGVVMALSLAAAVIYFMKTSRMGQAIRATAQDARAARVMGIDTEKIYAFTFSLNSAICGAAGAIIVMVWLIQPFYGITYSIRAFVIVTAAGLGNLPGVIAAGLGIGALEQYGSHIFGIGYQQAIAVLLLLLVLFIRLLQQRRSRQALQ